VPHRLLARGERVALAAERCRGARCLSGPGAAAAVLELIVDASSIEALGVSDRTISRSTLAQLAAVTAVHNTAHAERAALAGAGGFLGAWRPWLRGSASPGRRPNASVIGSSCAPRSARWSTPRTSPAAAPRSARWPPRPQWRRCWACSRARRRPARAAGARVQASQQWSQPSTHCATCRHGWRGWRLQARQPRARAAAAAAQAQLARRTQTPATALGSPSAAVDPSSRPRRRTAICGACGKAGAAATGTRLKHCADCKGLLDMRYCSVSAVWGGRVGQVQPPTAMRSAGDNCSPALTCTPPLDTRRPPARPPTGRPATRWPASARSSRRRQGPRRRPRRPSLLGPPAAAGPRASSRQPRAAASWAPRSV
jgi:hypothetical protein